MHSHFLFIPHLCAADLNHHHCCCAIFKMQFQSEFLAPFENQDHTATFFSSAPLDSIYVAERRNVFMLTSFWKPINLAALLGSLSGKQDVQEVSLERWIKWFDVSVAFICLTSRQRWWWEFTFWANEETNLFRNWTTLRDPSSQVKRDLALICYLFTLGGRKVACKVQFAYLLSVGLMLVGSCLLVRNIWFGCLQGPH